MQLSAASTENNKLKTKLSETEAALETSRKTQYDERSSLTARLEEANKTVQMLQTQQQSHLQRFNSESDQKNAAIRQLEGECSRLRIDSSQKESKVESLLSEMNELHSAMASLHGEISVLQRELEGVQEKERKTANQKKEISLMLEMKEADLIKVKLEKEKVDVKNSTLEIKLSDANERIRGLNENHHAMENLTMERDSLQSVIGQMESRLRQQTSTNQELNGLLNKLHGDIQRLQQELNDSRDECSQIGDRAKSQEEKMRGEIQSLQSSKADLDAANLAARKECESILSDMTVWKERGETLQNEQRKQAKRIEKLEREKHELFIELGQKSKDCEAFSIEIQNTLASDRDSKQLHEELKAEHELLKKRLVSKEDDIEKLHKDIRDIKEAAFEKENKLREETARCEQVIESSRSQQRENANRVVDFSQKNAKLTADLTLAQDELDKLKAKVSAADDLINGALRERDESIRQHNATRVRLQSLEDTVEELTAKLEAAEAEADDCRRLHQEGSEARAREATQQRQAFDQELRRAKETFQTELDEKTLAAANSRRQAEQHAERTVARARETFQRQIEELQAIRKREQADFTSRTAAITSAMEGLQRELREESIKSTAASEELFSLREQLERNNRDDDSSERIQRLEREKARDRVKFDGIMQSLKDDLQVLGEKLDRSEQQCGLLEKRFTTEKEARAALLQKYRRLEEELNAQQNAFETANHEGSQFKKQLREVERKASATINAKDAEIQRLIRRGEVLSEAVNRLTAGGTGALKTSLTSQNHNSQIVPNSVDAVNDNVVAGLTSSTFSIDPVASSNDGLDEEAADLSEVAGGSYAAAPPPHRPAYPGRSNSGEADEIMPPPSVGGDVNAHLQRVQNALDRRRRDGGNRSNNDASFGRSILQQAAGAESGRSTAPQLNIQDDDDISKASNDDGSIKSQKKKRIVSAPGFTSPHRDRRAHQPTTTILGNITPSTKARQSKGVSFNGSAPTQFLSEPTCDDKDSTDTKSRPTSGDSNYVQKMRENIELYHNVASPSQSPIREKGRGGGITYLEEGTDMDNIDSNQSSKNASMKAGSRDKVSSTTKSERKSKKQPNASSKLAAKAYS